MRLPGFFWFLLAGPASVAAFATSEAPVDPIRIDLEDAVAEDLIVLPGITSEEVERLLDVAGPIGMSLADRLAATGIPQDRLREWVPYLYLHEAAPPSRRSARLAIHSDGSRMPTSVGRFRETRGDFRYDLRLEGSRSMRDGTRPGRADGRFGLETRGGGIGWIGCMTGKVGGEEPWGDPFRRSLADAPMADRLRLSESRTARGAGWIAPAASAVVWREERTGWAGIASGRVRGFSAWAGACNRDGVGIGLACAPGGVDLTGRLRWSGGDPPACAVAVRGRGLPLQARLVWSPGRSGWHRLMLEGGTALGRASWKAKLLATATGGGTERGVDARSRVELQRRTDLCRVSVRWDRRRRGSTALIDASCSIGAGRWTRVRWRPWPTAPRPSHVLEVSCGGPRWSVSFGSSGPNGLRHPSIRVRRDIRRGGTGCDVSAGLRWAAGPSRLIQVAAWRVSLFRRFP